MAGQTAALRCQAGHDPEGRAEEGLRFPTVQTASAQSAPVPRRAHCMVVEPFLYILHIPRAVQHACSRVCRCTFCHG